MIKKILDNYLAIWLIEIQIDLMPKLPNLYKIEEEKSNA